MAVKKRPDESVESLINRFKKEVLKAGIIKDFRNKEYYVSPGEKRRRKSAEAQKRAHKN